MNKQPNVIFFLVNSMRAGGAERQISYLLNAFPDSYVISTEKICEYSIPDERIIYLSNKTHRSIDKILLFPVFIYRMINILRAYPPEQRVLVSFNSLPHLIHYLTSFFLPIKLICSVRSTLSLRYKSNFGRTYLRLLVFAYQKAQVVTVNSEGSKNDLIQLGVSGDKIVVIPNMYDVQKIQEFAIDGDDEKWHQLFKHQTIIQVGRFDYAKGHRYFLSIFSKLLLTHPHIKLVLVGKGGLKEDLMACAFTLGLRVFDWEKDELTDNYDVYLVGHQQNPYWFTKKATIFALTSLFEGLPNVLIEALITGTVCISTDCQSGPREILAPNSDLRYVTNQPEYTPYGVLMPPFQLTTSGQTTIEALENQWVKTLSSILLNEKQQTNFKENAVQRGEDYNIDKIATKWKNILYR